MLFLLDKEYVQVYEEKPGRGWALCARLATNVYDIVRNME